MSNSLFVPPDMVTSPQIVARSWLTCSLVKVCAFGAMAYLHFEQLVDEEFHALHPVEKQAAADKSQKDTSTRSSCVTSVSAEQGRDSAKSPQ
eukprot:6307847-Amphidinium_carterae.1